MRIALTIAGSDSGGAAGIQADLKTFHQFGVFGTSAITAVTAQNTIGVAAWQALPAALVAQQIDAVADDLRPAAIKSGMLGSREIVDTVAERIGRHRLTTYVLDPVMVATSGDRLLDRDAERLIARRLAPLALLVTPNLNEAEILVDAEVRTPDQMEKAGRALVLGRSLEQAVADGLDFVHRAIAAAPGLGSEKGHGPLNHFVPAPPRPPTEGL